MRCDFNLGTVRLEDGQRRGGTEQRYAKDSVVPGFENDSIPNFNLKLLRLLSLQRVVLTMAGGGGWWVVGGAVCVCVSVCAACCVPAV